MANSMRTLGTMGWHVEFLKAALWYNVAVLFLFMCIYFSLDFEKHFESKERVTPVGKVYVALLAHTAVGSGDIVPKTDLARGIMAVHVLLAWMQLLLVFL